MAAPSKKPRLSSPHKEVMRNFSMDHEKFLKLKSVFESFCSPRSGGIASLTIMECNAAYGRYRGRGKPFSEAAVDVKTNVENIFPLGYLFLPGVAKLKSYFENPEKAIQEIDGNMAVVLSRLFLYLMDKGNQEALMSIRKIEKIYKSDLAVRLAEHFFTKLGASSSYTLDDQFYLSHLTHRICYCGCNTEVQKHYGDRSIGNSKVWHGQPDILLGSCDVPVTVIPGDDPDSPIERNEMAEVKSFDTCRSQMLAQTIVSSFIQKRKHKEQTNFLIPSIGINKQSFLLYFYDSEHDILLRSAAYNIFSTDEISTFCILTVWFVVNYKFLCSGIPKKVLKSIKKANFFDLAGCQLPVYQKEVSVGGLQPVNNTECNFQPWVESCSFIDMPANPVEEEESSDEELSPDNEAMSIRF